MAFTHLEIILVPRSLWVSVGFNLCGAPPLRPTPDGESRPPNCFSKFLNCSRASRDCLRPEVITHLEYIFLNLFDKYIEIYNLISGGLYWGGRSWDQWEPRLFLKKAVAQNSRTCAEQWRLRGRYSY